MRGKDWIWKPVGHGKLHTSENDLLAVSIYVNVLAAIAAMTVNVSDFIM